jgi:hypothetical protein
MDQNAESDTPLIDALTAAIAEMDAAKAAFYDAPEAGRDGSEWDRYSAAYDAAEAARAALASSDEPRTWTLSEEGFDYSEIEAENADEALEEARSNVDRANYNEANGTIWIDVSVRCELTGEEKSATVALHEDEPECEAAEHDWQSPHEIVGGIEDNPGVWAQGGGVIITECCMRCGCARITDTWAQRMDTGEQGLRSVSYEPGKYADEISSGADDA